MTGTRSALLVVVAFAVAGAVLVGTAAGLPGVPDALVAQDTGGRSLLAEGPSPLIRCGPGCKCYRNGTMLCGNETLSMSRNESRAALRNVSDAASQYVTSVVNSTLSFINATDTEMAGLSNKTDEQHNKTEAESDVKESMKRMANLSQTSAERISNATISLAERIRNTVMKAVRKVERGHD